MPPVLPLVLYNGEQRWSAPRQVQDLIEELPDGLSVYRPSLQYLVIDEGELSEEELASLENLAAALFRLEQSRKPREVRRLVDSLVRRLQGDEDGTLRQAFGKWLHRVLLPDRFPEAEIPEVGSLEDAQTMLRQRVLEWDRRVQELKEEGLQKGRREGERRLLLNLLERKFGTVDPAARRRIEIADDPQLLAWGENLLTAERLEDVFSS